jgi:hypothetical protein
MENKWEEFIARKRSTAEEHPRASEAVLILQG